MALGARQRAAVVNALRRRRDARRALPSLHQTAYVPIGGPFPTAATVVKNTLSPVTFKTRVLCDGTPSGALLTVGSSATGLAFVGGKLQARVNGVSVLGAFTFAAGVRYDIAFAIVPATGRFRAYVESQEVIDGTAAPGAYVTSGALTLANAGVRLDEGLRVYALHVPQGLYGPGTVPPTVFDDLLFRATAHLMGPDQFTPPHIATP